MHNWPSGEKLKNLRTYKLKNLLPPSRTFVYHLKTVVEEDSRLGEAGGIALALQQDEEEGHIIALGS
jgi:hypothetical protein